MPVVNIYEEENWPIRIQARSSGKLKTLDVKVKIAYPAPIAEKVEDVTLDEGNESKTVQHKTEPVPDDQPNYLLTAKAEYKNKLVPNTKKEIEETCRVWAKTLKVIVKDDKGKKVPKFKFNPKQGSGMLRQCITGDDGTAEVTLLKNTDAVTFEPAGPWIILEKTPTAGKRREVTLKVKRAFLTKFVSLTKYKGTFPPTDDKPLTAYVNLDVTKIPDTQLEVWGNEVEIEVAVYDVEGYEGAAGDEVFVQAEFGRESKRNKPLPELKDAGALTKAANAAGTADAKQIGKVTLAANSAGKFTAKFKVDLGFAGGDTCSVKLANAKDGFGGPTVPEVKFLNWRRLYYELLVPDVMWADPVALDQGTHDMPAAVVQHTKNYMDPTFVEYKFFAARQVAAAGKKGVNTAVFVCEVGRERYVLHDDWETELSNASLTEKANKRCMKMRLCDSNVGNWNSTPFSPEVTTADFEFNLPGVFLKKKKSGSNSLNFAAFGANGWKVKFAHTSTYKKYTTLEWNDAPLTEVGDLFATPEESAATANTMTVTETAGAGSREFEVTFAANSADPSNGPALTDYIKGLLANDAPDKVRALRKAENKIAINVALSTAHAGDLQSQRLTKVKDAITAAHTTHKKKIPMHPGLDDEGNPRKGALEEAWLEHKTWNKVIIKLPTGGTDEAPKPGDIMGAESDTKAPIVVKFKIYENDTYLGGALKDKQTMVVESAGREQVWAQTLAHELGHSMGMTISEGIPAPKWDEVVPPGLPVPKHVDDGGPIYSDGTSGNDGVRDNGDIGPHCTTGAEALWGQPDADWNANGHPTGTCIMWGSDAATILEFCPVCVEYIKARNLSDISTDFNAARAEKDR